jgi:hypothetical protein
MNDRKNEEALIPTSSLLETVTFGVTRARLFLRDTTMQRHNPAFERSLFCSGCHVTSMFQTNVRILFVHNISEDKS